MKDRDLLAALQAENVRLIALLDAHGIEWQQVPEAAEAPTPAEPHR